MGLDHRYDPPLEVDDSLHGRVDLAKARIAAKIAVPETYMRESIKSRAGMEGLMMMASFWFFIALLTIAIVGMFVD